MICAPVAAVMRAGYERHGYAATIGRLRSPLCLMGIAADDGESGPRLWVGLHKLVLTKIVLAGQRVEVFKFDAVSGDRLGLLAAAVVGEGGWVDAPEPIIVKAGEAFIAVPEPAQEW